MPEGNTYVEFITFSAKGLDQLDKRTQEYTKHVDEARKRNARLASDINSGTYAKLATQLRAVNREYEMMQKKANLQVLVAEHGKFGAILRNNEKDFRRLGIAAGIGIAGAVGLAAGLVRSGLQGTVEGQRLDLAWTRLSRQVAGIAVPAIERLVKVLESITNAFRSLSGPQQRIILDIGLMTVGIIALTAALRTMGVVLGAIRGIGGAIGAIAGLSGLGGAGAAVAAAAASRAAAVEAGAGIATWTGGGTAAAGAAAGGSSLLSRGGRLLGKAGVAGAAALTVYKGGEDLLQAPGRILENTKDKGYFGKFTGGLREGVRGVDNIFGGGIIARQFGLKRGGTLGQITGGIFGDSDAEKSEQKKKDDAKNNGHRDVTPIGGEFREAGESFFTLQSEILKQLSGVEEKDESIGLLEQILEALRDLNPFSSGPPQRNDPKRGS